MSVADRISKLNERIDYLTTIVAKLEKRNEKKTDGVCYIKNSKTHSTLDNYVTSHKWATEYNNHKAIVIQAFFHEPVSTDTKRIIELADKNRSALFIALTFSYVDNNVFMNDEFTRRINLKRVYMYYISQDRYMSVMTWGSNISELLQDIKPYEV